MLSSKTLIKDAVVVPMTGDGVVFTGSVGFEGNMITFVGPTPPEIDPATRIVDGRGRLVMPGLVNTHTHVAMTLMRNAMDDVPLMTWLEKSVWPFEATLTAERIAEGARVGIAEMLAGGTTTMVDMYWHEAAIARVAREAGIRAVLCPSFVDGPRMEEFERDLPLTLEAAAGCDRLSVRVAPHSAYSCSEQNLRRGVELAKKHGLGIHTHVSETLDEQHIIREKHGCTPTEYMLRLGLFDVPAIAAHCVHVSDGDIEILRGKGVSAVHNPQSNMKLASGAAPVAKMLAAGVNVALGTDGAASNNDLDMVDEMRTASLLAKLTGRGGNGHGGFTGDPSALPAYEVLEMATVNGARAIGMEGRLGVLTPGALADIIMLDITGPHWFPNNNPINALVYSAKSSDVNSVWVAGSQLS